jgi:hypothetical protein
MGIRVRSDQFVTSAACRSAVRSSPENRGVVHPCGSQLSPVPHRPGAGRRWVMRHHTSVSGVPAGLHCASRPRRTPKRWSSTVARISFVSAAPAASRLQIGLRRVRGSRPGARGGSRLGASLRIRTARLNPTSRLPQRSRLRRSAARGAVNFRPLNLNVPGVQVLASWQVHGPAPGSGLSCRAGT